MPGEARTALDKANTLAPSEPDVVLALADACLAQRDLASARKALASIRSRAQNLAEYHCLTAQCALRSRQRGGALAEIHRAIAPPPQHPISLLTAGRVG